MQGRAGGPSMFAKTKLHAGICLQTCISVDFFRQIFFGLSSIIKPEHSVAALVLPVFKRAWANGQTGAAAQTTYLQNYKWNCMPFLPRVYAGILQKLPDFDTMGGIHQKMAEYCLTCFNRVFEQAAAEKDVTLSQQPALCEGCKQYKRVVLAHRPRASARFKKKRN